jgi:hypothetical protein
MFSLGSDQETGTCMRRCAYGKMVSRCRVILRVGIPAIDEVLDHILVRYGRVCFE